MFWGRQTNIIGRWTMKFGKHKGKEFQSIPLDYLTFLMESGAFDNEKYKSNLTIKSYINARIDYEKWEEERDKEFALKEAEKEDEEEEEEEEEEVEEEEEKDNYYELHQLPKTQNILKNLPTDVCKIIDSFLVEAEYTEELKSAGTFKYNDTYFNRRISAVKWRYFKPIKQDPKGDKNIIEVGMVKYDCRTDKDKLKR